MSRPIILLLSGPNLDLFGSRDPAIYGTATLADLVEMATTAADRNGFDLEHSQSASEAELVATIHAARGRCAGIVINPAAFTHYAWSLHDALQLFDGPKIELHMSNPNAREAWRHQSVVSPVVNGSIMGFGQLGYEMAIDAMAKLIVGTTAS